MASKRLDAIKLAKSSRWEELGRLVDAEPATAQQVDSYGMLPLHWACTEPQSIGEGVLLALLKAFPTGSRAPNTAEMLPLQIAIKAQARIEWLQALLASYPDAVLKKAPTGENAVQLARKAGLPNRSIKLLEEMYHHVCAKEGLPDQLAMEKQEAKVQQESQQHDDEGHLRPSERFQAIAGDLPVSQRVSTGQYGQHMRRLSSTASLKLRSFSDNDFYTQQVNVTLSTPHVQSVPSPWSPRRTIESIRPQSISAQRPSTTLRGAVSLPPRWMNAPMCSICAQKFGTFKKRHHCRNCGQSICRDHSARERMKLPHYGLSDRHRVCVVCHDVLRNASRQVRQQQITMQVAQRPTIPVRASQAVSGDARRSEETPRSPTSLLERHVSAPARAPTYVTGPYRGGTDAIINEQVASLQKQVSMLMEEKQQAEKQLRVQAEMLNDPDRLTNGSRGSNSSTVGSTVSLSRDRQNSLPLQMRTGASKPVQSPIGPIPNPGLAMYRSTGQLLNRTKSAGNFRPAREVDIDSPMFGTTQIQLQQQMRSNSIVETPSLQRTTRLQDALNTIAAVESTYDDLDESDSDSDFEERQTDLAVVEAAKATMNVEQGEMELGDESENDVGCDTLPEVDVLVNLGHVLMEKGSVSAAVQAFTRAVEIRPDDPALHSLLGRAFYADENLEKAVASITKSLELEPSATNSTLLGKILFEKGDHEKAIAAYQQSLDMQK
ncbi:Membrane trafficking and cell signaling protein HRS, contains VHS and FYVE domains [Plasmopara halstedii]|uniref:Membrane trafficking and cell signaling protein HRS, contains VHS and FYVE domains n=1 Tax=Plasmopara halstedii TaxID=4781 RepID=A0A0P1A971_PLAHL|nr:Membrane trafficking and cell signaling protein HRS, contains VHS and FYVE domains [Plasmopara halstedii]CEG36889.1 Membrane trafficking and cell signaling protein HRS, contains VHS and FYVE domains [Plasmopara halstedii]|eukprot:XP_024573258.1 Membrane trafficking and cell signaling protein HRS, contains VHS and FYVE domains [Plasmopara halstedii]